MGSPLDVGELDEHPAHSVTLPPFCLDRTEVTVAAFAARRGSIAAPDACVARPGQARVFCNWGRRDRQLHPVNCVDWNQADAWCRATGGALPTEAQWEFAARGVTGREYPWGPQAPSADRANLCGAEYAELAVTVGYAGRPSIPGWRDLWPTTAPVHSFPLGQTPEGVEDLAGNVWKWVRDPYDAHAYEHPDPEGFKPREVSGNVTRVWRGGGWISTVLSAARGAFRIWGNSAERDSSVGFRCVHGVL